MNTPILFLLGAFALASLATLVVWIASRPRKERFGQSIETFSRDLGALAPPSESMPPSDRVQHKPGPRPTTSTLGRRPGPDPKGVAERPNAASGDGR